MENCDDPNPARRVLFEQPVWQTLQMFMGEVRTGCGCASAIYVL